MQPIDHAMSPQATSTSDPNTIATAAIQLRFMASLVSARRG
jgi:hypothetical protein